MTWFCCFIYKHVQLLWSWSRAKHVFESALVVAELRSRCGVCFLGCILQGLDLWGLLDCRISLKRWSQVLSLGLFSRLRGQQHKCCCVTLACRWADSLAPATLRQDLLRTVQQDCTWTTCSEQLLFAGCLKTLISKIMQFPGKQDPLCTYRRPLAFFLLKFYQCSHVIMCANPGAEALGRKITSSVIKIKRWQCYFPVYPQCVLLHWWNDRIRKGRGAKWQNKVKPKSPNQHHLYGL